MAGHSLDHPSWRRHLRWSEVDFFRMAYPGYHRDVIRMIEAICAEYSINRMVVFGSELAGFAVPFRDKKILFDVCDSVVLTQERELHHQRQRWSMEYARRWLALLRWKQTEKRLPRWFSHVTTINDADSRTIFSLAGRKGNVSTVPNGVMLNKVGIARSNAPKKRGLAFWGNLSFAPNREALRFFFSEIYLPYLSGLNIECCIVGRHAEPWLMRLAAADQRIRVVGFVKDLPSAIGSYPVMVNPMVIGSGMKNKVLEAFALGMGVVSTTLGMESITGAVEGEHFLEANDAESFAMSVRRLLDDPEQCAVMGENAKTLVYERYSWPVVSAKWLTIFNELGG